MAPESCCVSRRKLVSHGKEEVVRLADQPCRRIADVLTNQLTEVLNFRITKNKEGLVQPMVDQSLS